MTNTKVCLQNNAAVRNSPDLVPRSKAAVLCRFLFLYHVLLVGLFAPLHIASAAPTLNSTNLPPVANIQIAFDRDIKPIFESSCFRCHGLDRPKSHFRLDNREDALKGGENGVDIIPGDSAKSPLAHYVARLVEDMEMPPPGKGQPLTPEQIGLIRAWIDQGAVWGATNTPEALAFSIEPNFRWIAVSGDKAKFREVEGIKEGFGGGIEYFAATQHISSDKILTVEGHAQVPDEDIQIKMTLEKKDVGFIQSGFDHWRRYYDDTGGFHPLLPVPSFNLDRDLHLDMGRAWADFGLTLPDWPRMVFGYEYQFKQGEKSTLEWGDVSGKTIYPAAEAINEQVHIIKFDLTHDFYDWHLEDNARVEIYDLKTSRDDLENSLTLPPQDGIVRTHETADHVQGQNSIRLERQITEKVFVSGGYLYSRLDGGGSLDQTTINGAGVPVAGIFWSSDVTVLKRESHIFSVAGQWRPWESLHVALGVQPEWTTQNGFAKVHYDEGDPALPQLFFLQPATIQSDLDTRKFSEEASIRYTQIPYTVLFAEGRWENSQIGQREEQVGDELFLGGQTLLRNTDFTNDRQEYRVGFNTSPLSMFSLNAHYKRTTSDSDYDNHKVALDTEGYSAFIRARSIDTDEVQTRLALRPASWLKMSLTYQLVATDYKTATDPVSGFNVAQSTIIPDFISPGGTIFAGNYDANVYGFNAALSPIPRLYFSSTFTYSDSRTKTAQNADPSIVSYRGGIYSAMLSANYALNKLTDLHAAYSFSHADYGQSNEADGLPLGLNYTRHGLMAGVTRRLTSYLSTNLRYAFYEYSEPSTGGINNYVAHGVFATLIFKWP